MKRYSKLETERIGKSAADKYICSHNARNAKKILWDAYKRVKKVLEKQKKT